MCLFLKTIFEDKKNSFLPNYNWNIVESGVKHHNPFLPIVDPTIFEGYIKLNGDWHRSIFFTPLRQRILKIVKISILNNIFTCYPLDKWDWCKTGTLNIQPWAIKVSKQTFLNELYSSIYGFWLPLWYLHTLLMM
jgi:hypothetical protein